MLLPFCLGVCFTALSWGVYGTPDHTFTDIAVDCNVNAAVLAINATALVQSYPDLDPQTLYVGHSPDQSKCRSDEGPRGTRLFHMPYGDCDPDIQEFNDGGVRVVYTVRAKRRPTDDNEHRDPDTDLDWDIPLRTSCILPKDGLQLARLDEHSSVYQYVGDNHGPYQFQMTVYKDAFMTNPVDPDDEVPLGSPLWINVKFNKNARSEMYIRDCWATSTPGGEDFEHTFIRNSVIGEDDETFIPVDDVITANSYGFSFDAFMFRGSGNRVYVKCNVYICTPEYTLEHPDLCATPTYPAFYRGERDLSLDFSGSGSGYIPSFSTTPTTPSNRRKRDVAQPEKDLQEQENEEETRDPEIDGAPDEEEDDDSDKDYDEDDDETDSEESSRSRSTSEQDSESGSGSGYGSGEESGDEYEQDEEVDGGGDDDDHSKSGDDGSEEESPSSSGSGSGSLPPENTENETGLGDTNLRFHANNVELHKDPPVFYIMHSFKVKHTDRKRKSTSSSRVYPRRTVYSTVRNGITLAIIIASTAMISACAVLLPLLFSGEKMRCLHVKPVKRVI